MASTGMITLASPHGIDFAFEASRQSLYCLPNEIILMIIQCFVDRDRTKRFHDRKALATLRLVSRIFNFYSSAYLFDTITLPPWKEQSIPTMNDLSGSTLLGYLLHLRIPVEFMLPASFMRIMDAKESESPETPPLEIKVPLEETKVWADELLQPLFSFLKSCPNEIKVMTVGRILKKDERLTMAFMDGEPVRTFYNLLASAVWFLPATFTKNLILHVTDLRATKMLWNTQLTRRMRHVSINHQRQHPNQTYTVTDFSKIIFDLRTWQSTVLPDASKLIYLTQNLAALPKYLKPSTICPSAILSKIERLRLDSVIIEPDVLRACIWESRRLHKLVLNKILLDTTHVHSHNYGWKHLFELIRTMPRVGCVYFTRLTYRKNITEMNEYLKVGQVRGITKPLFSHDREDHEALMALVDRLIRKNCSDVDVEKMRKGFATQLQDRGSERAGPWNFVVAKEEDVDTTVEEVSESPG